MGPDAMIFVFCAFSYGSWGSQGKNTEVVCHSLLQWTTFCQTSPPWPAHLGWPHTAWLSFIELDKAVFRVIRLTSFLWLWFVSTTGEQLCPWQDSDATEQGGIPLSLCTGFRCPHTNHTLYKGHNSQHILRKDVAGIRTETSPCTKDTEHTQSTQICCHLKTPPRNHSG